MKLKEAAAIHKSFNFIEEQVKATLSSKYTKKSKLFRVMSIWNQTWYNLAEGYDGFSRLFIESISNMLTRGMIERIGTDHIVQYIELLHAVMNIYEEDDLK